VSGFLKSEVIEVLKQSAVNMKRKSYYKKNHKNTLTHTFTSHRALFLDRLKCSVRVLIIVGDFYEVSNLPIEIFSYLGKTFVLRVLGIEAYDTEARRCTLRI
jgi:hypothetical protein